ncbi:MAG: prolyl oligopeptidase family serine peptidase [Phycisphaeraceae bacterium]|nr:prolyl oligopeptidase family serine peptidase [Phycisphaerales bacterium]MCB9843234.1 prolyl oligopeptidase family serine peptidase [Phycisphaeraceae bacterium]
MQRVVVAVIVLAGLVTAAGCAGDGRRSDAPMRRADARFESVADAGFLRQYAETNRFRNGTPRGFQVTPDGKTVLFLRSGARDFAQDLYAFDVETGAERVLVTADGLLGGGDEAISAEEQARRERMRESARGITGFELSEDGDWLLVPLGGRLFVMERASGKAKELRTAAEGYPIDARFSPDGKWVSCVRGRDVFVLGEEWRELQLTYSVNESAGVSYGAAEFVAQEEMDRREGYWWSPDSDQLLIQRTDESRVESVYIMDPNDPAKEPASWKYPRPGKANADVRLFLTTLTETRRLREVSWDRERYPYLAKVVWSEHAGHQGPTILVQNREQTEEQLLAVHPETGDSAVLLTEGDDAWVNIDSQMPRFLEDGSFLWTTERNGGWELERRNADGSYRNTIVKSDAGYRSLCDVDFARGEAVVIASVEPTETRVMRVSLDGGTVTELFAQEAGLHGAEFGDGGQHGVFVHTLTPARGEALWTVRTRDGGVVGEIASNAERPSFETVVELTSVGEDGLRCAVVRPRVFEKGMRFPVILHAYTGPGSQMVQASGERYRFAQWIADHGYIVVSIDGRGTPNRGRDWERVIRGNLVDIAVEDQVRGLRALGERYPEMDMDRVGVFGWSYGGYFSAIATMKRPDVFKCGVAGAPVCDWLDYDTHYTERYLGVPPSPVEEDRAYKASSVLTYAGELARPLMIIHGTADDNVYFVHALKMSDALTRAGKDHEFVVLGGFTHMVTEPAMVEAMYGRMMGFFGRELGE